MDSNYEIAKVTKELAERSFADEDYVEAKKLAQQAKDLFPELSFISIFITIIDIYLSYHKTVNGQPDWHAVIGLENPATLEKICERYFNIYEDVKSVRKYVTGAQGALQILSEAFCNLTGQFWTMCPNCQLRFQFSIDRVNKEMVCFNCNECYTAVPLLSGTHPTDPRPMSRVKRPIRDVVLALKASPSKRVGESGPSV